MIAIDDILIFLLFSEEIRFYMSARPYCLKKKKRNAFRVPFITTSNGTLRVNKQTLVRQINFQNRVFLCFSDLKLYYWVDV